MVMLLSIIGALALASIPLVLGWRRPVDEAGLARALGLAVAVPGFDGEQFARQTGTGLAFNQLAFGLFSWVAGGLLGGLLLGSLPAGLFAVAGGLLYASSLADRRQEFRLRQAQDIYRGLGLIETLLSQGRSLEDSLKEAAAAVGPAGQQVLTDLVVNLRTAPAGRGVAAVRAWTSAWSNPAVDIVGTALLAGLESHVEIGPLVASLRRTLGVVVEVLARARAAARGVEWQARFLALFPPSVLILIAIVTPPMRALYTANPLYVAPVLLGSGLSYLLSMRQIQDGLSIEASMGLPAGQPGEIHLERVK